MCLLAVDYLTPLSDLLLTTVSLFKQLHFILRWQYCLLNFFWWDGVPLYYSIMYCTTRLLTDLKNCLTPEIVMMMHVTIGLIFLMINSSLVQMLLDISGPSGKILKFVRKNALAGIMSGKLGNNDEIRFAHSWYCLERVRRNCGLTVMIFFQFSCVWRVLVCATTSPHWWKPSRKPPSHW